MFDEEKTVDINIHVYVHSEQDPRIDRLITLVEEELYFLKRQSTMLTTIAKKETVIMTDLTALTDAVTQDTDAVNSAITLINGLAAQIAAAGTDPVALQSLVDQLNTNSVALAQAVTANTAPPAPPVS